MSLIAGVMTPNSPIQDVCGRYTGFRNRVVASPLQEELSGTAEATRIYCHMTRVALGVSSILHGERGGRF